MSTHNPYQPPQSNVVRSRPKRKLGAAGIVVVVLAALQVVWSVPHAFSGLKMLSVGEIAPVVYFCFLIGFLSLAYAGVLVILDASAARYAAGVSLIFSAFLVLSGFRTNLYIAQACVAACLLVFAFVHFRVKDA